MKSTQERSNECLPPKKRDFPASVSVERPAAGDTQRSENLAWLASVAGGPERTSAARRGAAQPDRPQHKPLSDPSSSSTSPSLSSRPASSLSTVYASPVSHPRHLHQENSPAAYSQASKLEQQQRAAQARSSMPPPADAPPPHYVPVSAAPRTATSSPHHQHGPSVLHPHHTLAPLSGTSQTVVHYGDGTPRTQEELGGAYPTRELHNGDLGRRYGPSPESKQGSKHRDAPSSLSSSHFHHYDTHHYSSQDPSGLRTSLMLVPNSHGEHQLAPRASPDRQPASAPPPKGGALQGQALNRTPSTSSSSFVFPPPLSVESLKTAVSTLSPHTVIQTTHNATETLSLGLPASGYYTQQPIIGYAIAGGGGQQQPISYHAGLPQHLLIPGTQPVIIPVSGGGGVTALEASAPRAPPSSALAPPFPTLLPHSYIATAALKGEGFDSPAGAAGYPQPSAAPPGAGGAGGGGGGGGAVVHAQLHLPLLQAAPPSAAAPGPGPLLPPYFCRGSIIQLADGELKRVEDLKTEDFIQSAEVSSELKIDSSTVERIDGSPTPHFALVQFSVGEHRSQVSVEVLLEYPFFVFGQGWSSCCPDRTTQLLELPCTKLSVGDVCISLTLKNLRNGSLKKAQSLELSAPASPTANPRHGHLKPPRPGSGAAPRGGGGSCRRPGEQENGMGQRGSAGSGGGGSGAGGANPQNGDLRIGESESESVAASKPAGGGRKRRWSAPEGRKVEKTEEEPPRTLPRPSFLTQDVKISIEGHSSMGK
ncbi:ataxin-1a [Aplochiton taeniatus]